LSEFEQEVVKITHKCGRYIKVSPAKAKEWEDNPDSFHCELCYREGNRILTLGYYTVCPRCQQVFDSRDGGPRGKCYCTEDDIKKPYFKVIVDPKNQWKKNHVSIETQRVEQEIEEGKAEWKFKKGIHKAKKEAYERELRMDSNLQRIADSLSKKEPEAKPKDVNHGAIQ